MSLKRIPTFFLSFNIDLDDIAVLSTLRSPVVGRKIMEENGIGLDVCSLRGEKINFEK